MVKHGMLIPLIYLLVIGVILASVYVLVSGRIIEFRRRVNFQPAAVDV